MSSDVIITCCISACSGTSGSLFLRIKCGILWWARKRIHYSGESRIEKSIPLDHCLSSLCKPLGAKKWSSGQIFISYPHTHDRFIYSAGLSESWLLVYLIKTKISYAGPFILAHLSQRLNEGDLLLSVLGLLCIVRNFFFKKHLFIKHWPKCLSWTKTIYQNCLNGSAPPNKMANRAKNRKIFKQHHLNCWTKFKLILPKCSS